MFNLKYIERFFYIVILLNCCILFCITSISISTEYWVIVRPYKKQILNRKLSTEISSSITRLPDVLSITNDTRNIAQINVQNDELDDDRILDEYYEVFSDSVDEKESLLPFDLHALKDCKRYTGKIRFGLFKGTWLLNYGLGCKNRINHVSSQRNKLLNFRF